MQVCLVSLPACEIPTPAPSPRSYACSASRSSKFKAQHLSPAPSLHMRYHCLPSPPTHWAGRLSWRNGAEKRLYHCPAVKGWAFYQFCVQGEHTRQLQPSTVPRPHFMTLSEFRHTWGFFFTVEKQRPVQYSMLRTEALKTGVFQRYLIGLQIIGSEHKSRERLDLVFKQLNTGFSLSYPDVKHTV